jgi:hypothetical protein
MANVVLPQSLAEDLIETKLKALNDQINRILEEWIYNDVSKFLSDADFKELEGASADASRVRNFIKEINNLLWVKDNWQLIPEFPVQE